MHDIGGMPRRAFVYSATFHLVVVAMLYVMVNWHIFDRRIVEETPLVVQLVNVAPETRATEVNRTPPRPDKPEEVAQVEPPKPEPPKPEPPKPAPPPPTPPKPEPPKPEPPKPEPPKPEPPKPEPPKPPPPPPPKEAKAETPKPEPPPPKPAPPKKKDDDAAFDTLLKNLAKKDPARAPSDQPPQKQTAAAEPKRSSSQQVAPLGAQLTTSELDLVKQQIEACWNVPAGARDAKDLTPEFRVYMNQDGTVRSATQLNADRNSDPFFQAAADSALRALRNPRCQPLKLPPQKYDQWQTFTITFDPKDIL
jgi:hypothetical protein